MVVWFLWCLFVGGITFPGVMWVFVFALVGFDFGNGLGIWIYCFVGVV